MRHALRLVAFLDWLCCFGAKFVSDKLAHTQANLTYFDAGMGMYRLFVGFTMLLGLTSGAALFIFASSTNPKKWGGIAIAAGLVAPFFLMCIALR